MKGNLRGFGRIPLSFGTKLTAAPLCLLQLSHFIDKFLTLQHKCKSQEMCESYQQDSRPPSPVLLSHRCAEAVKNRWQRRASLTSHLNTFTKLTF